MKNSPSDQAGWRVDGYLPNEVDSSSDDEKKIFTFGDESFEEKRPYFEVGVEVVHSFPSRCFIFFGYWLCPFFFFF